MNWWIVSPLKTPLQKCISHGDNRGFEFTCKISTVYSCEDFNKTCENLTVQCVAHQRLIHYRAFSSVPILCTTDSRMSRATFLWAVSQSTKISATAVGADAGHRCIVPRYLAIQQVGWRMQPSDTSPSQRQGRDWVRGEGTSVSLKGASFAAEIMRLRVPIQRVSRFPAPAFSAPHKILTVPQRPQESYCKIIPTRAKLLLAFYLLAVESCYTYCFNNSVYDLQSIFSSPRNWVSVKEKQNKTKQKVWKP